MKDCSNHQQAGLKGGCTRWGTTPGNTKKDKIMALLKQGLSVAEIIKRVGTNESYVYMVRRNLCSAKPGPLSYGTIKGHILSWRDQGKRVYEIQQLVGCTPTYIYDVLGKYRPGTLGATWQKTKAKPLKNERGRKRTYDYAQIADLIQRGLSTSQIAGVIGKPIEQTMLRYICSKMHVKWPRYRKTDANVLYDLEFPEAPTLYETVLKKKPLAK